MRQKVQKGLIKISKESQIPRGSAGPFVDTFLIIHVPNTLPFTNFLGIIVVGLLLPRSLTSLNEFLLYFFPSRDVMVVAHLLTVHEWHDRECWLLTRLLPISLPSTNQVVVRIFPLSRPSGRAGVVNGEDSEQRVEQQAAKWKPLNEMGEKKIKGFFL